jgi:hypothetical protein
VLNLFRKGRDNVNYWFATVYNREVNVLRLPVSMTHEICVQDLCLLFSPNNNCLISEIQFKYIYATVYFTCPVENVRNLSPCVDTVIWYSIDTVLIK